MSSIREIRALTGLSHKQLAEWLGVSKSLVWYAETGGRSLPQAALLKLGAITVLIQGQLRKLQTKRPQLNTRLALFEALRHGAPHWYRVTDADKTWMELTEWFTRDRLPLSGPEQQELLQDKIDTHLASAELHRQQRENYEGMGGEDD